MPADLLGLAMTLGVIAGVTLLSGVFGTYWFA
jgi:hypothetical protein